MFFSEIAWASIRKLAPAVKIENAHDDIFRCLEKVMILILGRAERSLCLPLFLDKLER